ncbi:putative heat shock 70 kDa protein-like [Capsicum annuum]|nr:putative heat shock 70 kDa protein-like [Capsicum annuum]
MSMAGLSSFTLTPISSKPLLFPSLKSSIFGLCFNNHHQIRSCCSFPLVLHYSATVYARYGGGGGGGGGRGGFRPTPRNEEDEELDISSISYVLVLPLFTVLPLSLLNTELEVVAEEDSGWPHLRSCSSLIYYSATVSARYGGGGGGRGSEEDEALDISSIRSDKVRLIDDKQNMLGIVSKMEALQRAEDASLDLVILSPEADPPVVKIMDYNKYKYEQQKKKKEQQKKSAVSGWVPSLLEIIPLLSAHWAESYNIDSHDYSVRLKAAQRFLKDGDKVKVIVNLKGRENEFRNNAIELLRRFQNDVGELATEENKNFRDRNVFIVLIPNKAVVQKGPEQPKKKEKPATEVSASV